MKILNLLILIVLFVCGSCANKNVQEADKYFHEGERKIITRDFTGAEADFTKAIELDPECYTPYHGRGEVRLLLGKKHEGLQDMKKAMQLMEENHSLNDPQYQAAYNAIKLKYESSGGK